MTRVSGNRSSNSRTSRVLPLPASPLSAHAAPAPVQGDCGRLVFVTQAGETVELFGATDHDGTESRTPDEHRTSVRGVKQNGLPGAEAGACGAPGGGWLPFPSSPGAPQPMLVSDASW